MAIGNWVDAILRFLTIILITRILGAESYGIWAFAMAVSMISLGFVSFGFDRIIPLGIGANRDAAAGFALETGILRLGTSTLGAFGIMCLALFAEPAGESRAAVLLVALHFAGRSMCAWARPVFIGIEKAHVVIALTVAMRLLEMLTVTVALFSGAGVLGVLAIGVCFACLEAIFSALLVRRYLGSGARPSVAGIRGILRDGTVLGVSDLLTQWLTAGPLILLRWFAPNMAAFGQVALSFQMAQLAVATFRPFVLAALPILGRMSSRQDARMHGFGRLVALAVFAALSVASVVAWGLGPYLVPLVFGAEFWPAGWLLAPCLLVAMAVLLPLGYESMLVVAGRRWAVVAAGAAGALMLPLVTVPALTYLSLPGIVFAAVAAWGVRASFLCAYAPDPTFRPGERRNS